LAGGYPRLRNFETTVPGLYILGALASESLGPITRFVCGTLVLRRLLMPSLRRPRP